MLISLLHHYQPLWLPKTVTDATGRELTTTTLLGPFLAISVFAEEDSSVAEKHFAGKDGTKVVRTIAQGLQQELELMRVRDDNSCQMR